MIDDKNPRRINPKGIGLIYIYIAVRGVESFTMRVCACVCLTLTWPSLLGGPGDLVNRCVPKPPKVCKIIALNP